MAIYRVLNGRKYPAQPQGGSFIMGDPALGRKRHKIENAVRVETEVEVVGQIERGFYLRVEPLKGTRGTLVRKNLFVDGVRLT